MKIIHNNKGNEKRVKNSYIFKPPSNVDQSVDGQDRPRDTREKTKTGSFVPTDRENFSGGSGSNWRPPVRDEAME